MTTVTAVRRALEEFAAMPPADVGYYPTGAARTLAENPAAVTIIANRLSDRGEAGNRAVRSNLFLLSEILVNEIDNPEYRAALEWAIDQLTPPECV